MIMVGVLMLSSLLNIAYLMPIPFRGFFCKPDNPGHGEDHGHGAEEGIHEAPLPCLIAISIAVLGALMLFFYPDPIFDLLKQMVAP